MRALSLLLLIVIAAAPGAAQDSDPKPKPLQGAQPDTSGQAKPQALPPGQTRVYKAIVMKVEGTAQARPKPGDKWRRLKKDDVLEPGASVRTGRKSYVALRVGVNATLLVERQSRVTIPEIVQSGGTLKTRVDMAFGKMDVKVDRIGLKNDFGVATPTATLAVRGTILRILWSALKGMQVFGVRGNKLRAILVAYITGLQASLSGADGTTEGIADPTALNLFNTYFSPSLGQNSPGEGGDFTSGGTPADTSNPRSSENSGGLESSDKRQVDKSQGGINGSGSG